MKKIIWTIVILLLLQIGGAIALVFSGLYNVAATTPHSKPIRWVLHETAERSIHVQARDIVVPQFTDAMVKTGAAHYREMCVTCHGAPGVSASAIGQGLNPAPPMLTEDAGELSEQELFWITKNGIKMTGMPAFGPTHNNDDLWAIVALVRKFPTMSADEYRQLAEPEAPAPEAAPEVRPEPQPAPEGIAPPAANTHQHNAP